MKGKGSGILPRPADVVTLMRPKHWIKNVLVFFPAVFGGALAVPSALVPSILGFFSLCAAASGIYVVNDLADVERDRANPRKATRPIASGAVAPAFARIIAATLFFLALVLDVLASTLGPGGLVESVTCLVVYVGVNLAYSKGLKAVPVVDVAILAMGYFLRVLLGSFLTGIEISTWLYLTVISLSFYLGLGKRRGERVTAAADGGQVREVVALYTGDFLTSNMTVFFTLGLVFYSLWATDDVNVAATSGRMAWTIPLVFLICLRYSFLLDRERHGDPVEVVFADKALMALICVFAVVMIAIIYFG